MSSTIDSFQFLWNQIEKDLRTIFPNFKTAFAIFGAYYAVKRTYGVLHCLVEATDSSLVSRLMNAQNEWWVKKYGPWAVVTGSSEGIGFGYAHELAKRGINVVLISRSERKLLKAKGIIESQCQALVEYIVADFAATDQTELYNHIAEQLGDKEIGLLVNNVGVTYEYPDVFLNVSRQKLWDVINVNIGAATMMTHMLLPQMVNRGKGGVVVITSGSSKHITPQVTVYSATKRYLDYFIEGVAYEYRHSGVTFQSLMPFYTATRMTGYEDSVSRHSYFIPSGACYAQSAVRTLGRSFRTTGYLPHTFQLWLSNMIPPWLWMYLMDKLCNSLRNEALNRKKRLTP